jgi:hypothetical protein
MERVVHKSRRYAEADDWDVRQHISMTPRERMRAARELKFRVFPKCSPETDSETMVGLCPRLVV